MGGALAIVDRTFAARLSALAAAERFEAVADAHSRDPIDLLAGRLATALAAERQRAENAEAEAARRIAEADAQASSRVQAARLGLVEAMARALQALADADLHGRLDAPELAREFAAAVALYRKTIFALAASAAAMGEKVGDIADNAETLTERARVEGARLASVRATLREAAQAAEARAAEGRAERRAAAALRTTMSAALAVVGEGAAALDRVVAERRRFGEIAERIASFAFQTHLIALNASVEAARAGEAGRGITIVAQELRALSQRSAEATTELSAAIAALATEAGKHANALREAARRAEGVAAPDPPRRETADADLFGPAAAALDAAVALAKRDADAGEAIGETSRSLQELVARLDALARHFRYPDAELAQRPEPSRGPVARLATVRRLKTI